MDITVILCTYNRCRTLADALTSIASSSVPAPVQWEVLVVDNNSTDQTREVIEDFRRRYPQRFRYLFEPRPGKSHALNSAIPVARGKILAFVDDDVTVQTTWLNNLTAPLLEDGFVGSGGRILPEQSFSPPAWLSLQDPHLMAPLALFDLGPGAARLAQPPFGTNMAFRREMFEKYGGFRTDLGPRPGSEIRSEDTEFGSRLLAGGEQLWYQPSAVVYHRVPPNRVQRKYFLTWWFAKGRADVREVNVLALNKLCLFGVPLFLIRRLVVWSLHWMISVRPDKRFQHKATVWTKLGEIAECYRQSRDLKKKKACNAEA